MSRKDIHEYLASLCPGVGRYVYAEGASWGRSHPCPVCKKKVSVRKDYTIGAHKKSG
jgi:hypothetical protein